MKNLLWIFAFGSGENTAVIFGYNCDVDLLRAIMIAWLIQSVIFGLIVSSLARKKRRSPTNYFWVGFFFGLIGLIYAAGVPKLSPEEAKVEEERIAEERKDKRDTKFDTLILIGGIIVLAVLIVLFAKH